MLLKPSCRRFLKTPFGRLYSPKIALRLAFRSSFVAAVGDATSLMLVKAGCPARVSIVDFHEKRTPVALKEKKLLLSSFCNRFYASNPAGSISASAQNAVDKAFAFAAKNPKDNVLVVVKGEEDLVFLPAVLSAPAGAMLFYGQPGKGVVGVRATKASKKKAERLIAKAFE